MSLGTATLWKSVILSSVAAPTLYAAYQVASKAVRDSAIDWQVVVVAWFVSFAFSLLLTISFALTALAIHWLIGPTRSGWPIVIVLGTVSTLAVGAVYGVRTALVFGLFAGCNALAFIALGGRFPPAPSE